MIWFRRFIAIILALLFVILSIVMLFTSRINTTFGNPHFYVDQLRKSDVYNFIYNSALPSALTEIISDIKPQNIPFDINKLAKNEAIPFLKQVLPPEWIQSRTEDAITQVVPYLLGDTDEFAVTIQIKDRLVIAQKAIKDILNKDENFNTLYNPMVTYAASQASSQLRQLPFKLTLTEPELESIVRKLISHDWLLTQLNQSIDKVFPYLYGDSDHFAVTVELKSRIKASREVIISIADKPEIFNYFEQMVVSEIMQRISKSVQLPFGLTLTRDEVSIAIRETLPQSWFKAIIEDIVNQIASYLQGESDSISVVISLADRKEAALKAFDSLANTKIAKLWESLPVGNLQQVPEITRSLQAGQLPAFRPPGMSFNQLKQTLGIDFNNVINTTIINQIPDRMEFTQSEFSQLISATDSNILARVRQFISEGYNYTDADLLRTLSGNAASLEKLKTLVSKGFVFTQDDLNQRLLQDKSNDITLAKIDRMRHLLKTTRQLLFLGWVVLSLLLAAIGVLGARKIMGKVLWASSVLGIAALIAFIITGPLYNNIARPEMVTSFNQLAPQAKGITLVAVEKASQIVYQMADTFIIGIRQYAIIAIIIALAGGGAAIVLPVVRKRR